MPVTPAIKHRRNAVLLAKFAGSAAVASILSSLVTGVFGGHPLSAFDVESVVIFAVSIALVLAYQIGEYTDKYGGYLDDDNYLQVSQSLHFTVPAADREGFVARLVQRIGEERPDWLLRAPHAPNADVGAYTEANRGLSRPWLNYRIHVTLNSEGRGVVTSAPTSSWVLFDDGTSIDHVLLFRRLTRRLGAELPPLPGASAQLA